MSKTLDYPEMKGHVMAASFEEKSVWVQLGGLVVVLGAYFAVAGVMLSRGVVHLVPYVPVFAVAIVLLIGVMIFGHIAAVIGSRPEPRDERDRLIEWRAESNSGWVLAAGVVGAIVMLIVGAAPVWVAHALLASLLASEVVKLVFQVVYYRRGMGGH